MLTIHWFALYPRRSLALISYSLKYLFILSFLILNPSLVSNTYLLWLFANASFRAVEIPSSLNCFSCFTPLLPIYLRVIVLPSTFTLRLLNPVIPKCPFASLSSLPTLSAVLSMIEMARAVSLSLSLSPLRSFRRFVRRERILSAIFIRLSFFFAHLSLITFSSTSPPLANDSTSPPSSFLLNLVTFSIAFGSVITISPPCCTPTYPFSSSHFSILLL